MYQVRYLLAALLPAIVFVAGCGKTDTGAGKDSGRGQAGSVSGTYVLADEPASARSVKEARKDAKDGDEVVVVGRIGGNERPWVEGRAVFWIVDSSLSSCRDTKDDNCPTPWDYCCTPKEELTAAIATVKIVDEKGKTVQEDARKLLGVNELDRVVVRGHAKRDDSGNFTILATGVFRSGDKH